MAVGDALTTAIIKLAAKLVSRFFVKNKRPKIGDAPDSRAFFVVLRREVGEHEFDDLTFVIPSQLVDAFTLWAEKGAGEDLGLHVANIIRHDHSLVLIRKDLDTGENDDVELGIEITQALRSKLLTLDRGDFCGK